MLNFPPPPPPPSGGNQMLNQLADYYRQLVEYHQQAAELAAQQLAHIEALLNPSLLPNFSTFHPDYNFEDDGESLEDITPLLELPSSHELDLEEDENSIGQEDSTITDDLMDILESNRGKVLHIDYIVRKLYGLIPSEDLLEVTQATKKLLDEGAKQKKWYAMPDSPGCWTIDLKEFPDIYLSNKITSQNKKSDHLPYCSRLPYSERLAQYDSTTAAIRVCLQKNYPHNMTTTEVLDWLYPEGVPQERRKKAAEAINNVLTKGSGLKGWQRVAPGLYQWTG